MRSKVTVGLFLFSFVLLGLGPASSQVGTYVGPTAGYDGEILEVSTYSITSGVTVNRGDDLCIISENDITIDGTLRAIAEHVDLALISLTGDIVIGGEVQAGHGVAHAPLIDPSPFTGASRWATSGADGGWVP